MAVILITAALSPAQAQYAGGNNGGSCIATVACPVSNIYAGGLGDGFSYSLAFCTSPAVARYTGGSYDGFSSQNMACASTYTNVSMGGGGDGFAFKSIICTNASIYAGGAASGLAHQVSSCSTPAIYAGGSGDGTSYQLTSCTSANLYTGGLSSGSAYQASSCSSTNIYAGGSYNGSSVQTLSCSPTASIYKGGSYNGSSIASTSCTSTNIYAGGSYNGGAIATIACSTPLSICKGGSFGGSAIASVACPSANIYTGGSGDGVSYQLAFCTSPSVARYTGGSYDGFSAQNIACPVNANVSTGGSGDGTAYAFSTCTTNGIYLGGSGDGVAYLATTCTTTGVYTGGQGDGTAAAISACGTPANVYLGGSGDGSSVAISACSSPANVYAGGSYAGFNLLQVACPITASIYKGGSYDGSSVASLSCTPPADIYAGGSYDGSSFITQKCCFPPTFLTQPSSQTACGGANITFTTDANSISGSMTYQWQESRTGTWNNITQGGVYGAPNNFTFTLTGVTAAMNGYQYRLVATVACGSSTNSNPATITIDQPQASPPNASVCENGSITINGTPSAGSGTYSTHTWSLFNAGITGASSADLTNANQQTVTFTAIGLGTGDLVLQYAVTDNLGCSFSAKDTVSVIAPPTVSISNNTSACLGSSITMTGNPSSGSGTGSPSGFLWERSSNAGSSWTSVQNTSSANYTTDNTLTIGSYLYRVTVSYSSSACSSIPSSSVPANVVATPTSNAGTNQELCTTSTFTLAGNDPTPSTGTWSIISGPGSITASTTFNSTVTGVTAGSSTVLQWSVNNGTCSLASNVTLTNDAAPTTYSVTGGTQCTSSAVVGLSGSDNGVSYQLILNGSTNMGSPVSGIGSAITFGSQTTAGTYTVSASRATCTTAMSGNSVVNTCGPIAYNVTGGPGCAPVTPGLDNSEPNATYQLVLSGSNVGSPVSGTGSAISFPSQTTPGTYTVVGTNSSGSTTMNGSAIIYAPPTAYSVTGGAQCGSATVGLFSSDNGVNYQLVHDGSNAGSPASGTGSAFNFGSQTTIGTYTVVATDATTGCSATMTGNSTVNTAPIVNALLNNCACSDVSSVYQSVVTIRATGGGIGTFTFSPLSSGDVLQTTIDASGVAYSGSHPGVKGVFWSVADGTVHSYQVSDGACTVTVTQVTQNGPPLDIPFASASANPVGLPGQGGGNGIQGSYNNTGANSSGISSSYVNGPALTCHQSADFGNNWVTYVTNNMDATGTPLTNDSTNNKAIVEINNYGQDLDSVSVSVYREPILPSVLSSSGPASACYHSPAYAMERHFVIQSAKSTGANSFGSAVGVRLYFSDAELEDLIYWTNYNAVANAGGPNSACASAQVVNNLSQLYVTKYTGPNENGSYGDNSPSPTGLYRIYGTGTTTAIGNGPSYFDGTNGNGVFGNGLGANRHFVEMNVREFSEFWFYGSGDADALPVEIVSLEAEAINNEYIQVRWVTDLEINNKEFRVERSLDGQNWLQMGTVAGHGNTSTATKYGFDDMKVMAGLRYYYRLVQVDFNGATKTTGVVTAIIYGRGAFNIDGFVPNPNTGATKLVLTSAFSDEITIEFFDAIGQRMLSTKQGITAGSNSIDFDLNKFAAGVYTAIVTSSNGVYSAKVVIAR